MNALKTYGGVVVLMLAMVFAVVRVGLNQIRYESSDVRTIRICHWQLESGFRESLQDLITDFEAMHLEKTGETVHVLQFPVPEKGYRQFVNTSLIGGTAPDIIEKGFAATAEDPSYVARFFRPLGRVLEQPNPFNEGTELEKLPWKETFVDGLQGAYDRKLMDYYYVPFCMFTKRIYYNVDLLREITGQEAPPGSWEAFQALDRQVRAYAEDQARPLVTVAGSKVTANYLRQVYGPMFLFDLVFETDQDYDGVTSPFEAYQAYREGRWSFNDERFRAMWSCFSELADTFQPGWTAAQRDDAVFLFVQERSLMFVSGSWDAQSVLNQVGGRFPVQVFDFPIPTDHPVYGKYVRGAASEAETGGGIPWSVTQQSPHPELCLEFLQFCTTRANNQKFNHAIHWLPIVRGAQMDTQLKAFTPRIEGYTGFFNYEISTATRLIGSGQLYSLFNGALSIDDYVTSLNEVFERSAVEGMKEQLEKDGRNVRNLDRILVASQLNVLMNDEADSARMLENVIQLAQTAQRFNHVQARARQILEQAQASEVR